MRFLRDNGLTLALMAAFLVSLAGMMLAGWADENSELIQHSQPAISFASFFSRCSQEMGPRSSVPRRS